MTEATQRILNLMQKQNLNAHQLEIAVSLPNASIQAWVKGKKRKDGSIAETSPSADSITSLARYFNVSADYLLCLIDKPTPLIKEQSNALMERSATLPVEFTELSQDRDFVDSAKLYNAMANEYKKQICAYILGIATGLRLNINAILGR